MLRCTAHCPTLMLTFINLRFIGLRIYMYRHSSKFCSCILCIRRENVYMYVIGRISPVEKENVRPKYFCW